MKKNISSLAEGFIENITQHLKWIVTFCLVLVLGGGIFIYMEMASIKRERSAQALFYEGEKLYLSLLKEKEKEQDPEKQADKILPTPPDTEAVLNHADTKKALEFFKKVLSQYPSTSTAWLSALLLGDILRQQNKSKEALELTQHLPWPKKKTSRLLSLLALNQRGSLLADTGDCKGALNLWRHIEPGPLMGKDDKVSFFYQEVRLRMGLCYEKEKDWQNAKNTYENLINEKKGISSLQETAKKISSYT